MARTAGHLINIERIHLYFMLAVSLDSDRCGHLNSRCHRLCGIVVRSSSPRGCCECSTVRGPTACASVSAAPGSLVSSSAVAVVPRRIKDILCAQVR